jgi:hypothetical protein
MCILYWRQESLELIINRALLLVLAHHPRLLEVSLELPDLVEEVRVLSISTLTKITNKSSQLHHLDLVASHPQVSQLDKALHPQALVAHLQEDRQLSVMGLDEDS